MALKQIQQTSQLYNLPVSVCGELAGDPIGALLLVGLGYRSLSMNTSNVARVKYLLRKVDSKQLECLSSKALQQPYSDKTYTMMLKYLESKHLAGFVRAGNK